jgi:hypothetical protein
VYVHVMVISSSPVVEHLGAPGDLAEVEAGVCEVSWPQVPFASAEQMLIASDGTSKQIERARLIILFGVATLSVQENLRFQQTDPVTLLFRIGNDFAPLVRWLQLVPKLPYAILATRRNGRNIMETDEAALGDQG